MPYVKYVAITIEALQPNGTWALRKKYDFENGEVITGRKTREWLIDVARRDMSQWNYNYPTGTQLRITGAPQPISYEGGSQ